MQSDFARARGIECGGEIVMEIKRVLAIGLAATMTASLMGFSASANPFSVKEGFKTIGSIESSAMCIDSGNVFNVLSVPSSESDEAVREVIEAFEASKLGCTNKPEGW
ncbi:MAG: hypothetical protein LBB04_03490 [Oscillospiraceae bacterium]|nr:hypothetical protein [Oscillospiraceae bacterium]